MTIEIQILFLCSQIEYIINQQLKNMSSTSMKAKFKIIQNVIPTIEPTERATQNG